MNTTIDPQNAIALLRPIKWEMGTRNFKHTDTALMFQIGIARSTCWVEVTVNSLDLFDAVIFKVRNGKRTELGRVDQCFGDTLSRSLLAEWCDVCDRKGW